MQGMTTSGIEEALAALGRTRRHALARACTEQRDSTADPLMAAVYHELAVAAAEQTDVEQRTLDSLSPGLPGVSSGPEA
jgi:hypothetical protein